MEEGWRDEATDTGADESQEDSMIAGVRAAIEGWRDGRTDKEDSMRAGTAAEEGILFTERAP
jgi:hypothetical protein